MIDRENRTRLVDAIRRYADEQITAFAFDDEVQKVLDATKDQTVDYVGMALWYHYDDLIDHKAGLSKDEWDYFQRLILLLESDGEVEYLRRRRWSVRQLIALAALVAFLVTAGWFGWGIQTLAVAMPFGIVSLMLSSWRERAQGEPAEDLLLLSPFASIAEVRHVRRKTPGFKKRRYPPGMRARKLRSRLFIAVVWFQSLVLWLIVSPLVLLVQAFPETHTTVRIRS